MEREDFGDWGDERFLGVCAEDWLWDVNERRLHDMGEVRARDLEEEEVDNAWDAENERDLFDIVREHEEEEDWLGDDDDDYLDCDWEE
jgi:hypothetical protein